MCGVVSNVCWNSCVERPTLRRRVDHDQLFQCIWLQQIRGRTCYFLNLRCPLLGLGWVEWGVGGRPGRVGLAISHNVALTVEAASFGSASSPPQLWLHWPPEWSPVFSQPMRICAQYHGPMRTENSYRVWWNYSSCVKLEILNWRKEGNSYII